MCQCGCMENDERLTLPGPGESFYVISLYSGCADCDNPAGVTIELITPKDTLYKDYKAGEFIDGPLKMKNWRGSKGAAIITGMTKEQFVKATLSHLIGVDSNEFSGDGGLDKIAAETILEELYDDSQVKPFVVR